MGAYENLINAIILQAIEDYKEQYKVLQRHAQIDTTGYDNKAIKKYNRKLKRLEKKFDEVINFFYSSWFSMLVRVNPVAIIDKLEREVGYYECKRIFEPDSETGDVDKCKEAAS